MPNLIIVAVGKGFEANGLAPIEWYLTVSILFIINEKTPNLRLNVNCMSQ